MISSTQILNIKIGGDYATKILFVSGLSCFDQPQYFQDDNGKWAIFASYNAGEFFIDVLESDAATPSDDFNFSYIEMEFRNEPN